jgi:serine/threonine-protein kinase RsbW
MTETADTQRVQTQLPDLEITLPARAENVAVVRHAVGGLGEVLDVDDQTLSDIKLAVTDACTNVVVHA